MTYNRGDQYLSIARNTLSQAHPGASGSHQVGESVKFWRVIRPIAPRCIPPIDAQYAFGAFALTSAPPDRH